MKKCANCEYFQGNECKRYPASVKTGGNITLTRYQTDPNDYCGEFTPRYELQEPLCLKNVPDNVTKAVAKPDDKKYKLLGNKRR